MLVRIYCRACGYEIQDGIEEKLLFRSRRDWIGFMLLRVTKRGKTARFLKRHEVPCPTCGAMAAWENRGLAPVPFVV